MLSIGSAHGPDLVVHRPPPWSVQHTALTGALLTVALLMVVLGWSHTWRLRCEHGATYATCVTWQEAAVLGGRIGERAWSMPQDAAAVRLRGRTDDGSRSYHLIFRDINGADQPWGPAIGDRREVEALRERTSAWLTRPSANPFLLHVDRSAWPVQGIGALLAVAVIGWLARDRAEVRWSTKGGRVTRRATIGSWVLWAEDRDGRDLRAAAMIRSVGDDGEVEAIVQLSSAGGPVWELPATDLAEAHRVVEALEAALPQRLAAGTPNEPNE